MNPVRVRQVLRADAVLDFVLGLLLLAATWDALYDILDLPRPRPVLYAQLAGALLLAFAYLLWRAATDEALTRPIAAVVAGVNAAGAGLIVAWRLFTDFDVGALGTALLVLVAGALVVLAVVEARIARAA